MKPWVFLKLALKTSCWIFQIDEKLNKKGSPSTKSLGINIHWYSLQTGSAFNKVKPPAILSGHFLESIFLLIHFYFSVFYLHFWVERGSVRAKCVSYEHTLNAATIVRTVTQIAPFGAKCFSPRRKFCSRLKIRKTPSKRQATLPNIDYVWWNRKWRCLVGHQ